ncbi:MAG: fluoride efflux transporter CrcB [Planctomycetota bacterium]|nr:fluoride efflux transporter CrcB [Planctomycetota bacterium]MDG1986028.1 fluoride efflux transporter CrcB [Planctomycetota bacterium]
MRDLLFVGCGGFIGAVARYGVSRALAGAALPLGTLLVNVAGSFAIGALWAWMEAGSGQETHRQFVAVGLLGALTTFSTFSLEAVLLMREGALGAAALVVVLNVVLALGAARLGMAVVG